MFTYNISNSRSKEIALWLVIAVTLLPCSVGISQESQPVDFARDIQPILSENCYFCHGPDAENREADLRLDVEDAAHDFIEPHDAESSDLFNRINSHDPDEVMPPTDSNRSLTKKQIELIKLWINQGATWGKHWAYRPIKKANIDAASPIDHFVSRKLKENQLEFSNQASKRTLIRRVAIDLTGLPPTLDELDEFLTDESDDAYAKMVDRYLASPAYGERMAWNWLNAARYADSNGYQGDNERTMWPWRDWVVKAYNENMPYDQFSKWQLAGDLYPDAKYEQKLATGFLRNHPINGEGGRIAEENRINYVMDMSETTGTVWLGLTFNCCRCHDHKYDPLTQDDYYSLFAFFNQTPVTGSNKSAQTPPIILAGNDEERKRLDSHNTKIAKLQELLGQRAGELADGQKKWEASQKEKVLANDHWRVLIPSEFKADHADVKLLDDQSLLTSGENAPNDNYEVVGSIAKPEGETWPAIQSMRLEALPHDSMKNKGLSRASSSNFVLTDIRVFVIEPDQEPTELKIVSGFADYEQSNHLVTKAFDKDPKSGWAVYRKDKKMGQPREAVFHFARSVPLSKMARIKVVLKHESRHANHNLGRFRLSVSNSPTPGLVGSDQQFYKAIRLAKKDRSKEQIDIIRDRFLGGDEQIISLRRQLKKEESNKSALANQLPKVMVMQDRDGYRKTFRLNRGNYRQPTDEVIARVPKMMKPLDDSASEKPNRLALANWLFDKSNPLTPRVTANRLWAVFFGVGLVKTTEDFGVQGEPPSHPELLDWLAAEYRDSGWDTKRMIRMIVNSRTYKQSSKTNDRLLKTDPSNRYLARSPRYRMPSWMIRDYALAASGRLVRTVGGKPVNTYQPGGVWEEASFGKKKFKLDSGDSLYRRSIYTFWRRIAAPTMFFDNSDRMTCSVKRYLTNTPLHALSTLNDVTFVEAARLLATEALANLKDDGDRIDFIYQSVIARPANEDEKTLLLKSLSRTREQFSDDEKAAAKFVSIGASSPPEGVQTAELASWSALCLAVFNLDESLTRQ